MVSAGQRSWVLALASFLGIAASSYGWVTSPSLLSSKSYCPLICDRISNRALPGAKAQVRLLRNRISTVQCRDAAAGVSDEFQRLSDNIVSVDSLPDFPDPSLKPEDVVLGLVRGLQHNDDPEQDSGLRRCFYFSNDMCKAAVGGDGEGRAGGVSVENFIKYAKNPTFNSMVYCTAFHREPLNIIPGTETRGAMATQVVTFVREGGEERKFLWTLQQERRPPMEGCWLVRQCLFMENAIQLTL
mmetsp:Transcript_28632/g.58531  ORF Transcript_28632/g.58531 Transcript_28632/m.58531 type:complete len:243 (-) Transcript_28632:186-914(-)